MSTPTKTISPNGFAVTGLVLNILGLLFSWVPFLSVATIPLVVVGLIFSIVGLILALKGRRGRKVMAIVATVIGVLALVISISVTNATAEALNEISSPTKTTAPAVASLKVGDTAAIGDQGLTVTLDQVKPGIESALGSETYFGVQVTFKNGTSKPEDMNGIVFWNMQTGDGETLTPEMVINDSYPSIGSASVAPGRSSKGWVFFKEVPLDGAVVQYNDFGDTVTFALS